MRFLIKFFGYNNINYSIKVSIIVPVYNVEKYLPQCLDSLINQTLTDIEIICVNDGSTDNSLKILQKYAKKDSRIKIISQANKGVASARNVGILASVGEYIGFVDSDDWIDFNYYEVLYTKAKKANADIVRSLTRLCGEIQNSDYSFNKIVNYRAKTNRNMRINEHPVVVWNAIYKRNLLLNNNCEFEEGLLHEDIPFTTRVNYFANKISPVIGTFYNYRLNRPNSITFRKSWLRLTDKIEATILSVSFINSVKYRKKDYISLIKRDVWRINNVFKELFSLSNETDIRILFEMVTKNIGKCKYRYCLCRKNKLNKALFDKNFDLYKSLLT